MTASEKPRARKTWRAWLSKELDRLADLRWQGLSIPEVAAAMGRTEPSVRNALRLNDVGRPVARRKLAWLDALRVPRPIRETAALMGVSHWAVKQAARKLRRAGFDIPFVRRRRS